MIRSVRFVPFLAAAALALSTGAFAADPAVFTLTAKDGKFEPETLEVPAGQRIRLEVRNENAAAIEFESKDLKQEKVIPPKGKATLTIQPLKPGTYKFVDEYKEATSKGQIVAK